MCCLTLEHSKIWCSTQLLLDSIRFNLNSVQTDFKFNLNREIILKLGISLVNPKNSLSPSEFSGAPSNISKPGGVDPSVCGFFLEYIEVWRSWIEQQVTRFYKTSDLDLIFEIKGKWSIPLILSIWFDLQIWLLNWDLLIVFIFFPFWYPLTDLTKIRGDLAKIWSK